MRVKFLDGVAGVNHGYYPGMEADIEDGLAQRWIAQGTCVQVKPKRGSKRETTTRDQRELAVDQR